MAAAAAAARLSALPDNLLQHILSFAPAKEAATSAVLSRRWRPLWRRTGVLNLDSRHYSAQDRYGCFDVFFRDAMAALAAYRRRRGTTTLKRLTLFLTEGAYRPLKSPPLGSLPFAATLRVLELEHCNLKAPPPSARLAFPCLTDLTLRHCFALEGNLQALVDDAPSLTSLALVNLRQMSPEPPGSKKMTIYMHEAFSLRLRLRSLTVTTLVLETPYLAWGELDDPANTGIELDMPSLRSFRYSGYPIKLSLASPAPALARVDLDATRRDPRVHQYEPTSRMLTSFSSTRALKLRLDHIEGILAGGAILPTFPNLKLLQVHGKCKDSDSSTAVTVARLLASCPAMSELRLRLEMAYDYWYDAKEHDGGPFGESMDRFERLACMSSAHRNAVQLDGVSGLLTNSKFSCLETTLRKVTLQFKAKEVNCFQVRLAKFLVENAMVLQEMHLDDGSQFWSDHLRHKVAGWRADAFQARNLPDAAGFRVYQLANPVIDPKPKELSGYH
ncbi:hypothetical protein D1007_36662 [Hordeum vulgare]|nr:hypothetical protein D1007_36662 [Hordeum vulgare]